MVLLHELLHASGFTSEDWPLFRYKDDARTPRTPRDSSDSTQVAAAYRVSFSCQGSNYYWPVAAANTVR
jgi:hypothetical protein